MRRIAIALLLACDKEETSVPAPKPSIAIEGGMVMPPLPSGDLQQDIAHFTTLEACIAERANMDPAIVDSLDNVGYDTFVRDTCRILEAAKTTDRKKCDDIDAGSLRRRCQSIVAITTSAPERCPMKIEGKLELGRDPTCVAAALRSPVLCAGAEDRARTRCDALVTHAPVTCDKLELPDARAQCRREVTRFQSILSQGDAKVAKLPAVHGSLEVHGDGHPDPPEPKIDLASDLVNGIVIVANVVGRAAPQFTMGQIEELALPHAAAPVLRTRFGVTVSGEAQHGTSTTMTLGVPSATTVACPPAKCSIKVDLKKLERTRGGVVELTIEASIGAPPQAYRIKADIATFVRDVVE